jgi:DNA (cytosine-5)-methyltransferase 1
MKKKLKAIDFFCGAGGITCGLQQAGIKVLAGIDIDKTCKETYEHNNKYNNYDILKNEEGGPVYINKDINFLSFKELMNITKIEKNDDNLIFVGCSPCQFWTQLHTSREKSRNSKNLLTQFQGFVEFFKPGYIIIENVPGLEKRKRESKLDVFLKLLDKLKYYFNDEILNVSLYGVPQSRKRYILIASRICNVQIPKPDRNGAKVIDFIGTNNGFPKVAAGNKDRTPFQHAVAKLSDKNICRLKKTKHDGGDRLCWAYDPNLQIPAYKDKPNIFRNIYGRIFWNKPGPTITTKFLHTSNGRFAHPEENRGISIREGATLQSFPKWYYFYSGSMTSIAKEIGNAVPPEFARRIGLKLLENLNG